MLGRTHAPRSYLENELDGYLLTSEVDGADGALMFDQILSNEYWSLEWPTINRILIDFNDDPVMIRVWFDVDSDDQFLHLFFHTDPDGIWDGMLPLIEKFVNQRLQEVHDVVEYEARA